MARYDAIAPAKLNIALHITGIRDDGYHMLDTLVLFADMGDRIAVESADYFSLKVTGPFASLVGEHEDNLVWRAAQILAQALGVVPRGIVTLDKRLPVGAGLGGGSADAVAACRLLLKLWGHIMPDDRLASLLLPLGADMPMCVISKPLIAQGIGEIIHPVHGFPAIHAVLCWPRVVLPTADVYGMYRHDSARMFAPLTSLSWEAGAFNVLADTRNILQRPAIACAPEVAEALLALETHYTQPFVRMSGSGACCVGYVESKSAADQLAAALRTAYPEWWIEAASIVS